LPWLGHPYDRKNLNELAQKLKVKGLPSLYIMNVDETIAETKGRGDIKLRVAEKGALTLFKEW